MKTSKDQVTIKGVDKISKDQNRQETEFMHYSLLY